MSNHQRSEDEPGTSGETHDHSVPKTLGAAAVVSFFFFAGGQLAKGQFRRALSLWALLIGLVAVLIFVASMTEPESIARSIGTFTVFGALGLLWLYQLWDAASRP